MSPSIIGVTRSLPVSALLSKSSITWGVWKLGWCHSRWQNAMLSEADEDAYVIYVCSVASAWWIISILKIRRHRWIWGWCDAITPYLQACRQNLLRFSSASFQPQCMMVFDDVKDIMMHADGLYGMAALKPIFRPDRMAPFISPVFSRMRFRWCHWI